MGALSSRKPTATDKAYEALKRRIMDNEFSPGSQHLEQELAEQLSLSRTPVREALQRLAAEGLVEVIPRRGARITPISSDDMAEIYLVLTGLEAAAAEFIAQKGLDAQQLQELKAPLDEMDQALARDDLIGWAAADERFHRTLVELTGNQRLVDIVQRLWDQSHRARMTTLRLRPRPTQSNQDHRAVVDAIERRDPDTAVRIHTRHRRSSGEMLVELLKEYGLRQL